MAKLSPEEEALICQVRVGHLATAGASGAPHVVPVCFAYDGDCLYSVLDRKPKRTPLTGLKRVRNILSNPNVALVLDHYEEDWGRLWYVLITGTAELIHEGEEHGHAIDILTEKYAQYRAMDLAENPVIKISPARAVTWGAAGQRG